MTPGSGTSHDAVQEYIDALLCEPALHSDAAQDAIPVAAAQPTMASIPVIETVAIAPDQASDADAAAAEETEPAASVDNNPFLAQLSRKQQGAGAGENVLRPLWADDRFSCQGFNVGGLKLAIPTEYIAGMQPLELVPVASNDPGLPTEPPAASGEMTMHYLGQLRLLDDDGAGCLVDVLDTARLVMPERYDRSMRDAYRYVLTLRDSDWCLAVDSIAGELSFDAARVRWRSAHTRREWLAGTVVDKMCALVDIDALNRHRLADRVMGEDEG